MNKQNLWRLALLLSVITIVYNVLEGIISVYFGFADESLSLFGFGLDSFIEVISGFGILHLVFRVRKNGMENRDAFEKTALRITATAFYILAVGLLATAVYNIVTGHKPQTTFWGIIISLVSIATMILLMQMKLHTGRRLKSDAIIADAHCTRTCVYLSLVLLASSLLYRFLPIPFVDSAGALGIAWFAFSEGRESWGKAAGKECSCSGSDCHIKD